MQILQRVVSFSGCAFDEANDEMIACNGDCLVPLGASILTIQQGQSDGTVLMEFGKADEAHRPDVRRCFAIIRSVQGASLEAAPDEEWVYIGPVNMWYDKSDGKREVSRFHMWETIEPIMSSENYTEDDLPF